MTARAGIWAVDFAVPERVRRNGEWPEPFQERLRRTGGGDPYRGGVGAPQQERLVMAHMNRFADDPYRGTVERRILEPGRLPSDLEAEAGRKVLARAGLRPSDVDLLLVHSIVADELLPRNDAKLHALLGLRADAGAVGAESICSSMLTQLVLAAGMVVSGQARRVLCIHSACHSLISDFEQTYSLYIGDAASAFVVGEVEEGFGLEGWAMRTDGSLHHAIRIDRERLKTVLEPKPQKAVVDQLVDQCQRTVNAALDRAQLRIEQTSLFLSHQPTAWWHPLCVEALGQRPEWGYETFARYGNMSACCPSVNLAEAVDGKRLTAGQRVLFFAAHAGYGYTALVLRWGGVR